MVETEGGAGDTALPHRTYGSSGTEAGYRVSVSLARYFSDERAYCYVWVDERYEAVAALERYLRRLFRLPGPFVLTAADHLLPGEEKIRVLRPGDKITPDILIFSKATKHVKLVELTVPWETNIPKEHNFKVNKYCNLVDGIVRNGYKTEFFTVEVGARGLPVKSLYSFLKNLGLPRSTLSSYMERAAKSSLEASRVVPLKYDWRKANDEDEEANPEEEISIKYSIDVDPSGAEKSSKKKKKKKSKPESAEPSVSSIEDEPVPPKKDKPIQEPKTPEKKKGSDMDISGSDKDTDIKEEIDGVTNGLNNADESDMEERQIDQNMQEALQQLKLRAMTLLNEAAISKPVAGVSGGRINKRKRIRKRNNKLPSLSMSNPDLSENVSTIPATYKPMTKPISHLRFDEPAMIQNSVNNPELIKPRIIRAVENISLSNSRRPSICSTPPSDNESIKSLYQISKISCVSNSSTQKEKELTVESITKRLQEFPVMDDVYPVAKDLILFKMLKMGKDYSPSFSNHILARVEEVNKELGLVKMSVLDGRKECQPTIGKFDLEPVDTDAVDAKDYGDTGDVPLEVDVDWKTVVEPRLVFP